MGKGNFFQQQYYGDGGEGMWMESQAQETYAEEYKGHENHHHHHLQIKPSFGMENHAYGHGHGGHDHGMLTKPGGNYGAYNGWFSTGTPRKFNDQHRYSEYEEFESYNNNQRYGHGHGYGGATNTMHMDHEMRFEHGNPYMGYNNKPTHGAHKFQWTAKGV